MPNDFDFTVFQFHLCVLMFGIKDYLIDEISEDMKICLRFDLVYEHEI